MGPYHIRYLLARKTAPGITGAPEARRLVQLALSRVIKALRSSDPTKTPFPKFSLLGRDLPEDIIYGTK